jgi:hypothetical protein
VSRFPVAFQPPAFSLLGHPIPAGELGVPHSRLTGQRPDLDGVTAFRTHELRPGWVPPIPRGRRCSSRSGWGAQPAPTALPRPVLRPRSGIPSCGALLYEASVRGLRSSPVRPAPRLAPPGWNGRLLGLSLELRTPPLPAAHVEGGARSSSTDLELLILQSGRTPSGYSSWLERWFAEQDLGRPHVAGNSMGGDIALELARRGAVASATALSPVGF